MLGLFSNAQDTTGCSKYISTKKDAMTGNIYTSGKNRIVISNGNKGLGIIQMKFPSDVLLNITGVGGNSCADEGDEIDILFTDSSRIILKNQEKYNCNASESVHFSSIRNNTPELELLFTKHIAAIRVWIGSSYIECVLTIEQAEQFMQTMKCLSTDITIEKKPERIPHSRN